MTISMKGVVLFVVVQISVVLCASTGKPSEKDLEGLFGGISAGVVQDGNAVQVAAIIPKSKVIVTGATYETEIPQDGTVVQLGATIPSKMSYDGNTYKEPYSNNKNARLTSFAIFATLFVVFTIISFIIGVILYITTKKTRRGHVVHNAVGQESEVPQPFVSPYGFVRPIQHPSEGGQNQQQNFYPATTVQQTTISPAPVIQPMQQFPSEGGEIQQPPNNKISSLQPL